MSEGTGSGEAAEAVKSITTPTRLHYEFTAAGTHAEFLKALSEGKLLGSRCSECQMVYVPARGSCPRCGVEIEEQLDVADKGTITTFCVVRVPSENIELKLPYVCAHILLDGSNIPFFALIQECDADAVRIGMRVEAVWAPKEEWGPTFENIRYFRPTGEKDVPVEELGDWV
jgi:uncharacterized OB-fold protein